MTGLLRELSDWVVSFADSDWSILILAVSSFFESIFFPIPPDPLLIGMGVLHPEAAIWLAVITTVSSVAGAVVGHWLGGRLGRPVLLRYVKQSRVETVERMFKRHGAWAVLIAAFTPIPYKVFAITAGVLELDRRTFILVSLIGRGARFFILGSVLFFYRDSIDSVEEFIDSNFDVLTLSAGVALLVSLGVVVVIARIRRTRSVEDPGRDTHPGS